MPGAIRSPRKSDEGINKGHQGAGGSRRQPGRIGAGVRTHPAGAARREGEEDPGRRVDGQCRRVGRLLGLDAGRLHLRRAVDHHRLDRRVRGDPELPGNAAEARHWRRRREDHAAVGRAGRAEGPVARGQPADPERGRIRCTRASSTSSRESRHKTPQQVDQIAQGRVWDGGTAHQIGLVDGFGGMEDAIAKAAQLAGLGNERGVRYLEPP